MENEKLKEIVWEVCNTKSPIPTNTHVQIRDSLFLMRFFDGSGYSFISFTTNGRELTRCRIERDMPADSIEWWIAAKLLDIPTEMPIEVFEADVAARQYQHDLDEARNEGFEDAKAQKLTSPEQELCAMIRDGLGKFKKHHTIIHEGSYSFGIEIKGDGSFDAAKFAELFDAVMNGNKPNLSADAEVVLEFLNNKDVSIYDTDIEKINAAMKNLCYHAMRGDAKDHNNSLKAMLVPSKVHRYRAFVEIMGVLLYWLDNEQSELPPVSANKHFRAATVAVDSVRKAIFDIGKLQDYHTFTHTETQQHPSAERINPSDSVVFVGACQVKTHNNSSQEIWINCGEMGMVKVWSQTEDGGIGKPIHHLYCEHVRVTLEMISEQDAKSQFTAMGGKWIE